MQGDIFFGLPQVNSELIEKIKEANNGKEAANYKASALAYIHLVQLGKSIHTCESNNDCIAAAMSNASPEPQIGFEGFEKGNANHISRPLFFAQSENDSRRCHYGADDGP